MRQSPFFFGWRPALRDSKTDVGTAYYNAAARAIDSIQNSGWISGGIDAAQTQIMGAGLQLNVMPDSANLGWDPAVASDWGRMVERRFEAWAADPLESDLEGKRTFIQIQAAALRQWFATGEIVVMLPYRRRYNSMVGTKISLIPSHRLWLQDDFTARISQGVKLDSDGMPIGYRFRLTDPVTNIESFVDLPARDAFRRPYVVHVFDGQPGQVRGITPMVSALRTVKQFDQSADSTLTTYLLQTIFAATIESEAPTEQVLAALQTPDEAAGAAGLADPNMNDYFAARSGWYSNTKIDLGTLGKIAHLFPGEKLTFNKAENSATNWEVFAKLLLREFARAIGVTYEQLTGDYSGATYSSVRMATADFWPLHLYRRRNILGRMCQEIYEAWLEEQIDLGLIELPGGGGIEEFHALRAFICKCEWRGPQKPQADDQKAASAHKIWRDMGVISDQMICSDLGVDYEDVYEQRAQEKEMRDSLGLVDATAAPTAPTDPNMNPDQGDGNAP